MTKKQIRLLQLLDEQVLSCVKCDLYKNGRAKPYWNDNVKYIILGEAPGYNEVVQKTPFVGKAGNILWEIMKKYNLERDDFLIVNTVNCRPVNGNKNGKPTEDQIKCCRGWVRKYIKVLHPQKILLLGSYSVSTVLGECKSIINMNGLSFWNGEFETMMVASIHPAYTIYNKEGEVLLNNSIKKFKELLK